LSTSKQIRKFSPTISSGSFVLDIALGTGGFPKVSTHSQLFSFSLITELIYLMLKVSIYDARLFATGRPSDSQKIRYLSSLGACGGDIWSLGFLKKKKKTLALQVIAKAQKLGGK